jgi:sulfoxide reductase heme-binding subunit YedZ
MKSTSSFEKNEVVLAGGLGLVAGAIVFALLLQTPVGQPAAGFLTWLFAADTTQATWYITRAAGLTGYILLWFSVAWGLAVPSKILDRLLHRSVTYDFHQFISLLSLGFIALHIGALLFDRYLPYSLAEVLVPFLSTYRPVWVTLGIIGMYLSVLVTVTYTIRSRIGIKAFRTIHVFSLVAYLGVTLHGIFAGTDSSLVSVLGLYIGTFVTTIFLTAYWLLTRKKVKAGGLEEPRTVQVRVRAS